MIQIKKNIFQCALFSEVPDPRTIYLSKIGPDIVLIICQVFQKLMCKETFHQYNSIFMKFIGIELEIDK